MFSRPNPETFYMKEGLKDIQDYQFGGSSPTGSGTF